MYWCNCAEAHQALRAATITPQEKYNCLLEYLPVRVDKEDLCVHCGYSAYFSKSNPNVEGLACSAL